MLAAVGVLLLDRATKLWVVRTLAPAESLALIPGILHLTHIRNPGAAFGLFPYQRTFLVAVSAVVMVGIFYYAWRIKSPWARFGLGLLLGGAMGNFIDRILVGAVVDFIGFRSWPVFHAGDAALGVGGVPGAGQPPGGAEAGKGEATPWAKACPSGWTRNGPASRWAAFWPCSWIPA